MEVVGSHLPTGFEPSGARVLPALIYPGPGRPPYPLSVPSYSYQSLDKLIFNAAPVGTSCVSDTNRRICRYLFDI